MKNLFSNKQFFSFILILFLTFVCTQNANASVEVFADRYELAFGETFNLTIKTVGSNNSNPDLSPINNDFEVLRSGTSYQTSIVNNNFTSSREIRLTLAPKKEGKLTIPAINVGKDKSNPIEINVLKAGAAIKSGKTVNYFMVAEVDNVSPYVQEQIIYTLKIYDSVGLYGVAPTLEQSPELTVVKLGGVQETREVVNGKNYAVAIYRFAVFPQRSGNINIPQLVLNAETSEEEQDDVFESFGFGMGRMRMPNMFVKRKPVRLVADSIRLNVKPTPSDVKDVWLPAKELKLHDAWKPSPPVFKVGEAISRTIAIEARGVTNEQIPDISLLETEFFKIYPDVGESQIMSDEQDVLSLKQRNIVYIPSKAGKATIPSVEIAWFNTVKNEMQIARLPALNVEVMPSSVEIKSSSQEPVAQYKEPQTKTEKVEEKSSLPPTKVQQDSVVASDNIFVYMVFGIVVGFLLSLLIVWFLIKKKNQRVEEKKEEKTPSSKKALSNFVAACKTEDLKQIRDAALGWGRSKWAENPPTSLGNLAERLENEDLKECVNALNRALYIEGISFDIEHFEKTFLKAVFSFVENEDVQKEPVPTLYPK